MTANDLSSASSNEPEVNSQPPADGAYFLSNVAITEKGVTTNHSREQIKIYAQGKYMFAFYNEMLGGIDVGAGNAKWNNGKMIEEPLHNHDGPLSGLSFEINIQKTHAGYEQILHGMTYDDGRVLDTMVEVWDRAPGSATEFDGLWKLETRKAGDIESTGFSEIKMMGGGHYALLQSQVDDNGQTSTHFGYGRLTTEDNARFKETGLVGSWDNYSESTTEITMSLRDNQHLMQSFVVNDELIISSYVRI